MRLVFAGTPDFAAQALTALIAAGHTIELVLTQPDRPAGRGLVLAASPVKQGALAHGIRVVQPRGLRIGGRHHDDARAAEDVLRGTLHDAMIVAAYGLILPPALLAIARHGCINIHASLLPRWRGAAPIQRAIEAGDPDTGVTIMQMDAGLDTGPMLLRKAVPIEADDTGATLTTRLAALGGEAIVEALAAVEAGTARAVAQDAVAGPATYAAKLTKDESPLDFAAPTRVLVDRIRAFDPWPGCSAILLADGQPPAPFKIWKASAAPRAGQDVPGRVLGIDAQRRVVVATADGAILLTELQKPGGKRLGAPLLQHDFGATANRRFVAGLDVMADAGR